MNRRRRAAIDARVNDHISRSSELSIVSDPQVHPQSCILAIEMVGESCNDIHVLSEYQRAFAKSFRARLRADDAFATSWMRQETPVSVLPLVQVSPLFNRISDVMCKIPDKDVTVFSLTSDLKKLTNVCSNVFSASRFSNLYSCMKADWLGKCQAILFDECDKPDDVTIPKHKKPLCCDIPYCVCVGEGDLNLQKRLRFHAAIKANFCRISDRS